MAFLCMRPDNPYREELRKKFKKQTGYDHYLTSLPYEELDYEDHRNSYSKGLIGCYGMGKVVFLMALTYVSTFSRGVPTRMDV